MSTDDLNRVVELERAILRALCQGYPAGGAMKAANEALRGYAWRYQEHNVVFEALQKVRAGGSVPLRERLAAQATRMGFPEVDWELYFDQAGTVQDIEELFRNLKELGGAR